MKKETVIIITKYLLDFMFFGGFVVTCTLPWTVKNIGILLNYDPFVSEYKEVVVIYCVLGIIAILILGELRKMFRTVRNAAVIPIPTPTESITKQCTAYSPI